MSRGGELALAVTMGYVLGRKRRMRWALALGTAAAAGRLSSGRGGLMGKLSHPSTSPGLGRLLKAGRPLVSAGGAAARTAVGGRIDSAADRLQQTAQRLRTTGRPDTDTDTDTDADTDTDTSRADRPRAGGRGKARAETRDADRSYGDEPDENDDRFADDDEYDDREDDDREDDDRVGDDREGDDEADDSEADDDEGDDDERDDDERDAEPRGRRRAETPRAPVRRRGR
jgi:hypothetical protein